jgi:hypothetical protein
MIMSDDQNDTAPAPPPTTHADDRELGYGAVDARPDIGDSEAAPGKIPDSDEPPPGGAYADAPTPDNQDDNDATSTREATHDRAS